MKSFCVRGFAVHKAAVCSFGFAAAVIGGSSIAAIGAAQKLAASNGEPQTSVISRLPKEDSIIETASAPIGNG